MLILMINQAVSLYLLNRYVLNSHHVQEILLHVIGAVKMYETVATTKDIYLLRDINKLISNNEGCQLNRSKNEEENIFSR